MNPYSGYTTKEKTGIWRSIKGAFHRFKRKNASDPQIAAAASINHEEEKIEPNQLYKNDEIEDYES